MRKKHFIKHLSIVGIFVGTGALLFLMLPKSTLPKTFVANTTKNVAMVSEAIKAQTQPESVATTTIELPKPTHINTPSVVKGIYMTSWVASTRDWRLEIVDFIKKSEINSVVIDIKDYSGFITFDTADPDIKAVGSEDIRDKDLREFIAVLHSFGIYTISRITVFQDPIYSKKYLDQAVQRTNGSLWKDRKGLSYVDPSSAQYRQYLVKIAKAAERIGFDELNFDYIRFPSDGNMSDIVFPLSKHLNKQEVLESFFKNLRSDLADVGIPMSADLFGMTMTNKDDLNIGQVLERAAPYFDYISPMVYPSHYPSGFHNFKNPADHPYEVVHIAMTSGVERMRVATSSPLKLRPWLQDFDLGAKYDATKVRAQIQATYDAGLTSWMIWDPKNKYTRGAYLPE